MSEDPGKPKVSSGWAMTILGAAVIALVLCSSINPMFGMVLLGVEVLLTVIYLAKNGT